MPIILCPNCQGKLRFPENTPARKVKCPSCSTVFLSSDAQVANPTSSGSNPAIGVKAPPSTGSKSKPEIVEEDDFEVVDDNPPPPSKSRSEERAKVRVEEEESDRPKSKKRQEDEDEDDRPKSKKRQDDDDDDRPKSKKRQDDDEDDDRPKSKKRRDDDEDDDRPKSKRRRDEDEEEDRPKSKRRRDEDEEDDDRPRSKRRRDEDEDDDRPRSKRRRDEDEEDDRPRSKRRRDEDEDDDFDRRDRDESPGQRKKMLQNAHMGMYLNMIGSWIAVGAYGIVVFGIILAWAGVENINVFMIIAGLAGIGGWLTSGTGIGFMVAGPRKYNGMGLSIATAATAGVHLILLIVMATSVQGIGVPFSGSKRDINWIGFVGAMSTLSMTIFFSMAYDGLLGSTPVLPILTNIAEIARYVLFLLYARAVMRYLKDKQLIAISMKMMIGFCISQGVVLAIGILFGLVITSIRPGKNASMQEMMDAMKATGNMTIAYMVILMLVITGIMVRMSLLFMQYRGKLEHRR